MTSGLALGFVGGLLAGRALRGYLCGVAPHDPATLLSVGGAVAAVVLVACSVPARRDARIDPIRALRADQ